MAVPRVERILFGVDGELAELSGERSVTKGSDRQNAVMVSRKRCSPLTEPKAQV